MHQCFKWLVRQALLVFFSRIVVQPFKRVKHEGPLLVVANHPNSFLDAVVIGACFDSPLYFLARGDAFERPLFRFLLHALHMIPIYRMREGRDQVRRNRDSFEACQALLLQGKSLLIFIEGICVNQHQLQPFKKGAARLALEFQGQVPLQILPVGIAFEHLRGARKQVNLRFGPFQAAEELLKGEKESQQVQAFNTSLNLQLKELIQLPKVEKNETKINPAVLALKFLHLPFLVCCKWASGFFTRGTVFYDSVLFALLFLGYPIYLLACWAFYKLLGMNGMGSFGLVAFQVLFLYVVVNNGFLLSKRLGPPTIQ
jgi:1-acyl-sn-glycerol-3-phosphate acyltransferase